MRELTIFIGNVRVSLHSDWANDRRLYPQRRICIPGQPSCDHNPSLLLRCDDPIQPNPAVLEILVRAHFMFARDPPLVEQ